MYLLLYTVSNSWKPTAFAALFFFMLDESMEVGDGKPPRPIHLFCPTTDLLFVVKAGSMSRSILTAGDHVTVYFDSQGSCRWALHGDMHLVPRGHSTQRASVCRRGKARVCTTIRHPPLPHGVVGGSCLPAIGLRRPLLAPSVFCRGLLYLTGTMSGGRR